jgi:putative transposase
VATERTVPPQNLVDRTADRAFWVALSGLWPTWHNALILVKPETVIGGHRKGFRLY